MSITMTWQFVIDVQRTQMFLTFRSSCTFPEEWKKWKETLAFRLNEHGILITMAPNGPVIGFLSMSVNRYENKWQGKERN